LNGVVNTEFLGAVVALLIFCGCIVVFISRLRGGERLEHWTGFAVTLMVFPLAYILWVTADAGRPAIYYLQLCLMITFLLVELLLDYVLKSEFRSTRWKAIVYVMFFFAATGGMIGVASNAGSAWAYSAITLFLIMGTLAFYQRAKTGK